MVEYFIERLPYPRSMELFRFSLKQILGKEPGYNKSYLHFLTINLKNEDDVILATEILQDNTYISGFVKNGGERVVFELLAVLPCENQRQILTEQFVDILSSGKNLKIKKELEQLQSELGISYRRSRLLISYMRSKSSTRVSSRPLFAFK